MTVTDTGLSGQSAPTGDVTFSSSPSTGSFDGSGGCTLAADTSTSASCTLDFTPAAADSYTVSAAYAGDSAHSPSTGATTVPAVDPTSTALACEASTMSINTTTTCTATLSDASSPRAPTGQVTFTAAPSTGSFGTPGPCQWTPAGSGAGGSATCSVTFTPAAAGSYTLTADYSGDSLHLASTGTTALAATTAFAGGGPGTTNPPGVTLPVGSTTPTRPSPGSGRISIAAKVATVSKRHRAAVRLACSGSRGAKCTGILTLTARVKVRIKTKVTVIVRVKVRVGHGKHRKTKIRSKRVTRTKTQTTIQILKLGSVVYTLGAGASHPASVTLSKQGIAQLAAARGHRLAATASAGGVVRAVVLTATAGRPAHHPKHKKKRKKKKKKK